MRKLRRVMYFLLDRLINYKPSLKIHFNLKLSKSTENQDLGPPPAYIPAPFDRPSLLPTKVEPMVKPSLASAARMVGVKVARSE